MKRAILGLATLLLVACQPAPPPQPAVPGAPAAAPGAPAPAAPQAVPGTSKDAFYVDPWSLRFEQPKVRGGTFTFAANLKPPHLDPFLENVRARPYVDLTYDTLVAKRLHPGVMSLVGVPVVCRLCESWELGADRKTYTFKLRQNVKFHDGKPFTADDVKFSYELAVDPKTASQFRSSLVGIASIGVVDPYTVRIVTKEPDAEFMESLALPFPMLPKHAYEGGVDFKKTAIGTGPFKMSSFDPEVEYVAVKNPDFWLPDRPILDRVVARFITETSTRAAALIAKQMDVAQVASKRESDAIVRAAPDLRAETMHHANVNSFLLNTKRPPFSDKRVRKAVHLALDRDGMAPVVSGGVGVNYVAPSSPAQWQQSTVTQEELAKTPGYRQPKDQDVAEAKRLLAEAGYPEGFKTTSMHVATFIGMPEHNEAASAQLDKAGIQVTLQPLEAGVLNKKRAECDFDLAGETAVGTSRGVSLVQTYSRYVTGGAENWCGYSHPEIDRLVAEIPREFDEKKRWEIVRKIQLILLDELPTVPFAETASISLSQPYVHNWRNHGSAMGIAWFPTVELIWTEKR